LSTTLSGRYDRTPVNIPSRFPGRFLQGYVRWKVAFDPIYATVPENVHSTTEPLIDLGCGVGILELTLRAQGFTAPIIGVDHDERKIAVARDVTKEFADVTYVMADARAPLPRRGNVVMFDLLHYFSDSDQQRILANIVEALPPGGTAIIREGLREPNWRYWMTYYWEVFARVNGWLKAEQLNFPTREVFSRAFPSPEFTIESRLFAGKLLTNNYLFVIRRKDR
jgi:SAM-dependent methyltransferase